MGYGMSYIEDNGYFTFDGVKSSDYGVWINGSGTYNAAALRYKEYNVPGRNGALTISENAFEEADHIYPAFIARNFPANVESFRNQLMSRTGYCRLTDSYHPNEFYRARYMSGLDADVAPGGVAASFNLTFRRDPRRFLTSGETVATYPPGIGMSKNLIPYPYYQTTRTVNGVTFTDNGDGTITVNGTNTGSSTAEFVMTAGSQNIVIPAGSYLISGCTGGSSTTYLIQWNPNGGAVVNNYDGSRAVDLSTDTAMRVSIKVISGASVNNVTFKPMLRLASDTDDTWVPYYDGSNKIYNPTLFPSKPLIRVYGYGTLTIGSDVITIASTGNPYTDIDSEIMDCFYGTTNVNNKVTFQSNDFPELRPGVTGIAYSGNITKVEITPRWYIV